MESWIQIVATIICSVLASSGFWAFLQKRAEHKATEDKQIDIKTKMLIGLGHDRIVHLGMQYVERGYITQDEYENLFEYLYQPYDKLGGNGSAKRIMTEVNKLSIHKSTYIENKEDR